MNQKATQMFESKCGKARIFVDTDTPIGVFHDFLMEIKGLMVDRMIQAHKEQQEQIKEHEVLQSESSCESDCA